MLADLLEEIDLPPGVVNIVCGQGSAVGEAIATHPDIDMISFTGSTRAGIRVSQLASTTIKKVALELGGKSANVLLPDADLATAVKVGVANAFLNAGQTCNAWTRMIVPSDGQDDVVELVSCTAAGNFIPADPLNEKTRLGPLANEAQQRRVLDHVHRARAEGAPLITGGTDPVADAGYFVQPAVFANVTTSMTVANEEVFGPVLSIMSYDHEDDALQIANSTHYGLSGGVWSADLERATTFARKMRTGQVDINGGQFKPAGTVRRPSSVRQRPRTRPLRPGRILRIKSYSTLKMYHNEAIG